MARQRGGDRLRAETGLARRPYPRRRRCPRRPQRRPAASGHRGSYSLPDTGIAGCGAATGCLPGGNSVARHRASEVSIEEVWPQRRAAHAPEYRGRRRPRQSCGTRCRSCRRAGVPCPPPAQAHPSRRHLRRARSNRGAARAARSRPLVEAVVDLMLQRVRGAEHENAARADRYFLPGLRVTPDPLSLLPHRETAEGGDLDHLAALERVGNLGDHRLDELCRLVARQTDFLIDRLGELSAGNRVPGHDALPVSGRLALPKNPVKFQSVAYDLCGVAATRRCYQRAMLAPQVNPPPRASISTRWPGRMRPSPTASSSASGIDAAEVLA